MKLSVVSGQIIHSRGAIPAAHEVLDAREIGDVVVAIYDYMAFPRGAPARNLFAYSTRTGELLWRAANIRMGGTDAYTNVLCESPLIVGNFAGFSCTIDVSTGEVVREEFTK